MEENLARFVVVIAVDFSDPILTRSVRTQHHITPLNPFGNRPQCAAGKSSPDSCFVWVCGHKDGDELLVERARILWQFLSQVLVNAEVCADEVAGKALFGVNASWSQHDAVITFHKSRILPVSSSCIMARLRSRVFSRRCSNVPNSASMSDSTSAMSVCSELDEGGTSTLNS